MIRWQVNNGDRVTGSHHGWTLRYHPRIWLEELRYSMTTHSLYYWFTFYPKNRSTGTVWSTNTHFSLLNLQRTTSRHWQSLLPTVANKDRKQVKIISVKNFRAFLLSWISLRIRKLFWCLRLPVRTKTHSCAWGERNCLSICWHVTIQELRYWFS
jgi:hypothetical protein